MKRKIDVTELDFESAQLQLVTDALRAGPGTPEWRAALSTLDQNGSSAGADEYKLLYTARERLASGQRYREVRAGAGFTRKVFESIEREDESARKPVASANLIAAISAAAILGILAAVAFFIIPKSPDPQPPLAQTYFVNTLTHSDFEGELGMEWAAFGSLGVQAQRGLQPVLINLAPEYHGGGVIYEKTLPPDAPFAVEATIQLPKPSEHLAVQVFVSDDPNFTGKSATSEHELAWLARSGESSVILPGGRVEGQPVKLPAGKLPLTVRITVSGAEASVEMNSKKLWSGRHNLDASKPRLVGVRFLARAGVDDKSPPPIVQSVRVLVPQK